MSPVLWSTHVIKIRQLVLIVSTVVRASQVALVVKNLPANAGDIEMQGQSLGWEDPLEEGTATHSSVLA